MFSSIGDGGSGAVFDGSVFNWFLPVCWLRNFHLNKSNYIGILCWITLAKFPFRQKELYLYQTLRCQLIIIILNTYHLIPENVKKL